jgi:ribosomal protein S12 methylthiotransferase
MDMKRKLGETDIRGLLDRLHERAPKLSLLTTFIVGYPGETDAQFEKLKAFVNEGHFNHLGAFTYSQEEGTPAGLRANQIPDEVRKERLAALQNTHFEVADVKARARIGRVETVVLENSEGEEVVGRSAWEAPEIDSVIRLPRAATRGGRFVQAKITGYDSFEYTAEPVS